MPDNLIDDVLAWWTDFQERPVPTPHVWDYKHRESEDAPWRRLRAAVWSDVFVQPADFAPEPILVRMFVDDVSGIGPWPSPVGWRPRASFDEATLPMTAGLRARIREWVEAYTRSLLGYDKSGEQRGVEHDRRGYALSQEAQAELGDDYLVQYSPHTRYAYSTCRTRTSTGFPFCRRSCAGDFWRGWPSEPGSSTPRTRPRQPISPGRTRGWPSDAELQRVWGPTFNVRP